MKAKKVLKIVLRELLKELRERRQLDEVDLELGVVKLMLEEQRRNISNLENRLLKPQ